MSQTLQQFFGETAEETAQDTKFVQRTSSMTGSKFLQTWVLGFLRHPTASLNLLSQVAADLDVQISRQGIQKRLTVAAVQFFAEMFAYSKEALQNKIPLPLTLLTQFTAVTLVDSSNIALPDTLQEEFPGAGGDGPQASLKLQTVWEFLRGNLLTVVPQAGNQPDQKFTGHLPQALQGMLFLYDLGYFKLDSFRELVDAGASFISRLNTHCALLDPTTQERFDLLAYLQQSVLDQIELQLLVGLTAKLPCRLVAVRLPAEVVEERRRKAKANARRKGRTLSSEKLAWLEWNLYLTNVPAPKLSLRHVVLLYRLRWQIELLFRLWKSEGELDRVAGRLRERVLCEIYAKLIGMVVFHYLTAPVRWAERELSPVKAFQTLKRHIIDLAVALKSSSELQAALTKLLQRWKRFALKGKRRTRRSTCKQIDLAAVQVLAP
jgi:hypothetical protein